MRDVAQNFYDFFALKNKILVSCKVFFIASITPIINTEFVIEVMSEKTASHVKVRLQVKQNVTLLLSGRTMLS